MYWSDPSRLRSSWQWQPTIDAHDPSPPIILEDPVVIPPGGGAIPYRMIMGVGLSLILMILSPVVKLKGE